MFISWKFLPLRNVCQPFYSGTWVVQLLATNLSMGATFAHLLIWNFDDMKQAWDWITPSGLRKMFGNFDWRFWKDTGMRDQREEDETLDPHYREMLKVSELSSDIVSFLS